MVNKIPKIDKRTSADIEKQVKDLLSKSMGWQEPSSDAAKSQGKGINIALIKIFARYCEIIIERLNKVPEKNFLAFLDLLGASRLPPPPARVPLTFTLSDKSTVDAVVLKGTQVAAQLAAGEKQPAIFETENELVVTAAKLESIFVRDLPQEIYADYSIIFNTSISNTKPISVPVFRGERHLKAIFQSPDFFIEKAFTNQLTIDLSNSFFPFGEQPKFGDTLYLFHGKIFFQKDVEITLKFQLVNPVNYSNETEINVTENFELQWEFWNGKQWQKIVVEDTTDKFRNFATETYVKFQLNEKLEKIKINNIENFGIRIRINAGKYEAAPPIISSMRISYKLTKQEEQIRNIEGDRPSLCFGFALPPNCQDFPQKPISLFMRLAQPKYNDEQLIPLSPTHSRQFGNAGTTVVHRFDLTNNTALAVNFRLLTSKGIRDNRLPISEEDWDAQPLIFISEENKLDLVLSIKTGETKQIEVRVSIPDHVKVNSSYRGFLQLERIDEDNLSRVYSATFETFVGTELPKLKQPQLSWQYWNGKDWAKLTVSDATENFTRPGVITFLPPKDFALRKDFGLLLRYWLRVRWESGDYLVEPRLKGVLLNTVMATQTVTISNEILGSSDGSENQKFRTTRIPVLKGQKLEVRETELPSAQEQKDIKRDEGDDAITFIPNTSGYSSKEYWVRWHEVPDFYASVARDRHYVINHLTGEIQFGDGRNGLIPPLAKSNIRMTYYQTGGGTTGNKPAGTIVQLKTTIPYVNRVTNYEPATGGTDAETPESLIERVPRQIRHHDRAVTLEDYEDIASLASAEVARVKCVPLRNLAVNPLDEKELPGAVSVIIMPYSTDAKPLPSLELISRVQNYLEAHADPTASINVVGPLYVRVNITAELALSSLEGAAAVEQSVEQKLASFLHPLTGGFDGTGWDFGREPYKSDFYRLLESVPGVDHVRYLKVEDIEDKVGAKGTKRFLVYSGKHDISPTFTQA